MQSGKMGATQNPFPEYSTVYCENIFIIFCYTLIALAGAGV